VERVSSVSELVDGLHGATLVETQVVPVGASSASDIAVDRVAFVLHSLLVCELIDLVVVEEEWDHLGLNLEESKDISVPVHLIFNHLLEELLNISDNLLSAAVKDLCDVDILSLVSLAGVLLLHVIELVDGRLINLGIGGLHLRLL